MPATQITQLVLASRAALSFSTSGTNAIIAAVAGKQVKVLQLFLMAAGNVDMTFQDTSGTALSGAVTMGIAGNGFVWPYTTLPWLLTAAGKGLQINLSSSVQMSGLIIYLQE